MPYIQFKDRTKLEPLITQLANEINYQCHMEPYAWAGDLNYVGTRLAQLVMPHKSYWTMALVIGVFITMALEFYRRVTAPYEDQKCVQNGEVYDALV